MLRQIDGIIERCGHARSAHEEGFYFLLEGCTEIHSLHIEGYARLVKDRYSRASFLALTQPGDHVSFETDGPGAVRQSFRNWTLEKRLFGSVEKDVTPGIQVKLGV